MGRDMKIKKYTKADLKGRLFYSLVYASPFGAAVALFDADLRLAALGFASADTETDISPKDVLADFVRKFKTAKIKPCPPDIASSATQLLANIFEGGLFKAGDFDKTAITLSLFGTSFQHRVWHALLDIPVGDTVSYGTLAKKLGTAPRALGGAVGANPLAYFIPCHRVIAKDGTLGGYHWGLAVKRKMLAFERRV